MRAARKPTSSVRAAPGAPSERRSVAASCRAAAFCRDMASELDIFVGNTTLIDEEVYQLWLDGHSGAICRDIPPLFPPPPTPLHSGPPLLGCTHPIIARIP